MKKARLKVTLACNKKCPYCINKSKEYRSKWNTITTISEVDWTNYRSIIISGGEPTMHCGLKCVLQLVRKATRSPIYLQTNGVDLTKELVSSIDTCIDGIGLSIHDIVEFKHFYTRYLDILRIKPIKLYIEDKLYYDANEDRAEFDHFVHKDFTWRVWKAGEFDSQEDIFLYKS